VGFPSTGLVRAEEGGFSTYRYGVRAGEGGVSTYKSDESRGRWGFHPQVW